MGHRGSKIGFSGINRHGFFMKIMFSMSVCVKNVTLDRFLQIFEKTLKILKNQKSSKTHVRSKIEISSFFDFQFFDNF